MQTTTQPACKPRPTTVERYQIAASLSNIRLMWRTWHGTQRRPSTLIYARIRLHLLARMLPRRDALEKGGRS